MASNVHTDLHCEHIQLLIYCIAMFCALGVALSVHDEWFQWFRKWSPPCLRKYQATLEDSRGGLQPQMFRAGYVFYGHL